MDLSIDRYRCKDRYQIDTVLIIVASSRGRSIVKGSIIAMVVVVAILLLLTPFVQSELDALISSPFQQRYPENVTFEVQDSFSVADPGGSMVNFTLDTPEPLTLTENGYDLQNVTEVTPSPSPLVTVGPMGQQWMTWNESDINGDVAFAADVTYQITTTTHFWNIGESQSLDVSDIPTSLKQQYLHDEWRIDMSNPEIKNLSASIVGNQRNVYDILNDIYKWEIANIQYPAIPEGGDPKWANQTLDSGIGDCDDQSILFIALARDAGVPAWLQLGALYDGTTGAWGGHGWVEAYIPEKNGNGEKRYDRPGQ